MNQIFDYVVIGSGAAGSVIAARLSEDPTARILVLEAGPSDRSVNIRMPGALGYALTDESRTWRFETGPESHLDGQMIRHERGRVLGGSSSINGMVFARGNPRDYEAWAARGLENWSYAHCLPYFKRFERYDGGGNVYRGSEGPVAITTMKAENPIFQAFLEAGQQAGHKLNPDYNAFRQEGVHVHQTNIDDGVRASAGRAYLRPALKSGRVTLLLGAQVTKILFDKKRAAGVSYLYKGERRKVAADREVILCGGAFNSPQVLLLSGIGDPKQLETFDIPLVSAVPGVGRGLQDHPGAGLSYRLSRRGISPGAGINTLKKMAVGAQWLLFKTGLGATNLFETGCFFQASEQSGYVDIQNEFIPLLGDYASGIVTVEDGFVYSVNLMRPESRGYVALSSADPLAHPRIVNNYLAEDYDRRTMTAGVRHTDEIIHQQGWNSLRGEGISPPLRQMNDADILAWLKQNVSTQYHPCGTCRMGGDDMSVVDGDGRVHGVENLRVVDASIMPSITTGNLHAPTLMLAEKLADQIRGKSLPPEFVDYAGRQ